jgi:hypothetical protein
MTFWYDGVIIILSGVAMVGVIWSSYRMNKRRREVRIRSLVKAQVGTTMPDWMLRLYESTFDPDTENNKSSSKG